MVGFLIALGLLGLDIIGLKRATTDIYSVLLEERGELLRGYY